jgi:hypothetical protein
MLNQVLTSEGHMTVKDTVKKTICKLESLCETYEKDSLDELNDLEETVTHLSHEVQNLNLAADQTLKTDLGTLQNALVKLSSVLKEQQGKLDRQVNEIHVHQQALLAYASVANNNLGSLA